MPDDWLRLVDVRGAVDKEVFDALRWLVDERGWRIRQQGHGFRVYCPCDRSEGGASAAVPGTSSRPATQARRLRRNAEHCPLSHQLVK